MAANDLEAISRLILAPNGEGDDGGQVAGEVVFSSGNQTSGPDLGLLQGGESFCRKRLNALFHLRKSKPQDRWALFYYWKGGGMNRMVRRW